MLVEQLEMPTSGQFICCWVFNNRPWSSVYGWAGSTLYEYGDSGEHRNPTEGNSLNLNLNSVHGIKFFVHEED